MAGEEPLQPLSLLPVCYLEGVAQCKLQLPTRMKTFLSAYRARGLSKLGDVVECRLWIAKLWMIENIEGFCPEGDLLLIQFG